LSFPGKDDEADPFIKALPTLKEKIVDADPGVMFPVISDLGKV